jgi:hypothetical protein
MSKDHIRIAAELHAQSGIIFEHIGRLASDWATIELLVNDCIWKLADVTPVLGACVTAQIFTINNRLMALISLMKLRGFPEEFIKEMNQFSDSLRGPSEKRNRAIHDPVFVAPETGDVGRLEITAQRKPVLEMKPVSEDILLEDRTAIFYRTQELLRLRDRILAKLPTLPEIPKSSDLPIDLRLVLQPQTPANKK